LPLASSATNPSCSTLPVRLAVRTTAVRFSRSDLFSRLTEALGISVKEDLLELAFTHRSYANEAGGLPTNERLEFLGDSVLGLIITEELYKRYPDLDESRLSPLRSGIVNTRALADIARALSLGDFLRIGKGEEASGGRDKNSILADCLEALVGAVYLDSGFDRARGVVLRWFADAITTASQMGIGLDGKTALQELAARLGLTSPEYEITESGPDHDKSFIATAIVGGEKLCTGHGKSKREAEQSAARSAYDVLASRRI
jgi:ribonuclease III